MYIIPAGLYNVAGQQCTSNPCYFNGTCTESGSNNYSCQCPPGFTGKIQSSHSSVYLKNSQLINKQTEKAPLKIMGA